MRWIVSAISGATESWRIFWQLPGGVAQGDGVGHHDFVQGGALAMRSMAGPEKIGCVQ
jgi:hypothetical protein